MAQVRAVVFDLGRVLVTFDYSILIGRLLPRMRVDMGHARHLLEKTPLLHQYESGMVSTDDFFEQVRGATGFAGDIEEFRQSFVGMFGEIPDMVALHAELRRMGVPTYVMSNTNELAIDQIRRQFTFFSNFDGYALSCDPDVKALKPASRIYEKIEKLSGLTGDALFYFDDAPENVEAARARQWQAIVHESEPVSRAALVRAGVLP